MRPASLRMIRQDFFGTGPPGSPGCWLLLAVGFSWLLDWESFGLVFSLSNDRFPSPIPKRVRPTDNQPFDRPVASFALPLFRSAFLVGYWIFQKWPPWFAATDRTCTRFRSTLVGQTGLWVPNWLADGRLACGWQTGLWMAEWPVGSRLACGWQNGLWMAEWLVDGRLACGWQISLWMAD
jgi:hypothetical protein